MEKKLIYNAIKTPDGTVLESKHVHDYIAHEDTNGDIYSNDGGLEYMRRSINIIPAEDMSLYTDSSHEQIREVISRGGRGKDGKQPLKYVLLKDVDDDWLDAIITYETQHRPSNIHLPIYKEEQKYRISLALKQK